MSRPVAACAVFAVATALAGAQGVVSVPDTDPTMGTCNVIPFGSAAYTYVGSFPGTTYMDPANPYVNEVSFAPCQGGTFSAPTIIIGFGHIASPLPCPFSFPTFDAAGNLLTLGSFLDFTIAYNSTTQGALNWTLSGNAWSPMGFGALGGTGFQWDGINDVGFFVTFQGATGGGGMHRTSTFPLRSYAGSFGAPTSTACNSAAGLKMRFDVLPAAIPTTPVWQVNQPGSSLDVDGAPDPGPFVPMLSFHVVNQLAYLNATSTNVGLPWDAAITVPEGGVPLGNGGMLLADSQIVNIDVTAPSFFFLFDLSLTVPFANASIPFALGFPASISIQLVNLDPTLPLGFALSHLNQILIQ